MSTDGEAAEAEAHIGELRVQLAAVTREREEARAALHNAADALSMLAKEKDGAQASADAIHRTATALSDENARLRAQLKGMTGERDAERVISKEWELKHDKEQAAADYYRQEWNQALAALEPTEENLRALHDVWAHWRPQNEPVRYLLEMLLAAIAARAGVPTQLAPPPSDTPTCSPDPKT